MNLMTASNLTKKSRLAIKMGLKTSGNSDKCTIVLRKSVQTESLHVCSIEHMIEHKKEEKKRKKRNYLTSVDDRLEI